MASSPTESSPPESLLTATEASSNPTWPALGYSGVNELSESDFELPLIQLGAENKIECEVLVIGSGAGGSVAAANLAARGFDVLVVDKGGNSKPANSVTANSKAIEDYSTRWGP